MKAFIKKIINIGVKPNYEPWEIHLTRKLNSIALIAFANMALGTIYFTIFNYTQFISETIFGLIAAPFVIIFNKSKNYVWAAYIF